MKVAFLFASVSLAIGTLGAPNKDPFEEYKTNGIFILPEKWTEWEDITLAQNQPDSEAGKKLEPCWREDFEVESEAENDLEPCWREDFEEESEAKKKLEPCWREDFEAETEAENNLEPSWRDDFKAESEAKKKLEPCWREDFEAESEAEKEIKKIVDGINLEDMQRELEKELGAPSNQEHEKPNVVCLLRAIGAYFKCVRHHMEDRNRIFYICAVKNWRKFERCFRHK